MGLDISLYKVYTLNILVYKGVEMTAKVQYGKELFSLPLDVIEGLKKYAKERDKKKSHIVSEAILEYISRSEKENAVEEALSLIGIISENTPDIQEIKANREDI